MFDLSNKVAFVTGAGRGIGLGIARLLASQGAAVAVNDYYEERAREAAEMLGASAGKSMAAPADVCDADAVGEATRQVAAELGPIDILVNNAGIPPEGMALTPFLDTEPADWDAFVKINLLGVMSCTRMLLPGMCERGQGRIVTIVSEAWRSVSGMGIAAYAAGKGGAVSFSRQLSGEVAPQGVTVNCVSLGIMDNVPDAKRYAAHIPCRRPGSAEDVAAAVLYLVSDEASWVTGQVLTLNGGIL